MILEVSSVERTETASLVPGYARLETAMGKDHVLTHSSVQVCVYIYLTIQASSHALCTAQSGGSVSTLCYATSPIPKP